MTLPLYHEDLVEFFERSNEPSIFPHQEKGEVSLESIKPGPGNLQESIKAIWGVTQALVHLRINLIMPCQIKYSYVIRKKGVWGLRHVICDQSTEEEKGEDIYNPQESKYHGQPQCQLVWNIGKIWLRFLSDAEVQIKYHNQQKINKIIDRSVENFQVNRLVKRLLTWNRKQRITFEQFLNDNFFIKEDQLEQTSFYSSLVAHFRAVSNINIDISTHRISTAVPSHSPFLRELRHRCFLQYLDIDLYFQHVRAELKKQYFNGSEEQKSNCEFTLYIISLQNYFNMMKINRERLEIGERFQELQHRLYYTRFAKRMVTLRDSIEKSARKLKANPHLKAPLKNYCIDIDELDVNTVYLQFKSCLVEYAEYLNFDLKQDHEDLMALKLLVKIYIIRTSSYVFSEMRVQVFKPFMSLDRVFNIKKVLSRINECNDRQPFRELLTNIKAFYFK